MCIKTKIQGSETWIFASFVLFLFLVFFVSQVAPLAVQLMNLLHRTVHSFLLFFSNFVSFCLSQHFFMCALPISYGFWMVSHAATFTFHPMTLLHFLARFCLPCGNIRWALCSETEVQSHQWGAGPRSQWYDFHVNVFPACACSCFPALTDCAVPALWNDAPCVVGDAFL